MIYNEMSFYPGKIDDLLFFQDIDLGHLPAMLTYQNLQRMNRYTEANTFIDQQNGVHGYFADLFNLLENRVYNLQTHLLAKEKFNPMVHQSVEPTELSNGTIWEGGI